MWQTRAAHLEDQLKQLPAGVIKSDTSNECAGHGEVQDLEVRQHGRFVMQWATCTSCNGSGNRSLAA